ncbi:hypothetical protein [Haladaptatus halobius]|nr:hypothetical protein [Haladaptatus halobius]
MREVGPVVRSFVANHVLSVSALADHRVAESLGQRPDAPDGLLPT